MIKELCRTGSSLDSVVRLLQIQQNSFPDQTVNLQKAARELSVLSLVKSSNNGKGFFLTWDSLRSVLSLLNQELVQALAEIERRVFPDRDEFSAQRLCEEFGYPPMTAWWYVHTLRFLARCRVPERVSAIGVKKWCGDIETLAKGNSYITLYERVKIGTKFDSILLKLRTYEREYLLLKEAAVLLELALWKSKMGETVDLHPALKRECRINCRAGVIIPNVIPYLIP